jgi:hypothetical protein
VSDHGSRLSRWWWRGSHPLVRVGWAVLTKRGVGDPRIGAGLIAVGYLLRRRSKRSRVLLYRATMSPGESMRIRVSRGDRVIADRTIEG